MPVKTGKDSEGCFAQWGDSGKKYHYKCGDKQARERAKAKAQKQGRAARASGYGKSIDWNGDILPNG